MTKNILAHGRTTRFHQSKNLPNINGSNRHAKFKNLFKKVSKVSK